MYVAISQRLINETQVVIKLRKSQEVLAPTTYSVADHEAALIEKLRFGEHADIGRQIPEEWLWGTTSIEAKVINGGELVMGAYLDRKVTFNFEDDGVRVPFDLTRNTYDHKLGGYVIHRVIDVKEFPQVQEVIKAMQERDAVNIKYAKIHREVTNFLESCKSLNEAIKLWPHITSYVPESYVKKTHEKITKVKEESKAASVLANIDTDMLTASAVLSKLQGNRD
jgi:hypothetical protein